MRQVERSIFDLRRGLPVLIRNGGRQTLVAPLESLDEAGLAALVALAGQPAALIVTGHRLAGLGLAGHAAGGRLSLADDDNIESIICLASAPDAHIAPKRLTDTLDANETAALQLMQRGQLIPAAIAIPVADTHAAQVAAQIANYSILAVDAAEITAAGTREYAIIRRVSEARVPLQADADSRFIVFRETDGVGEHVAVLIGEQEHWPNDVPVRLHSACLTGDLFGSLRCDCGTQLQASTETIAALGGGVLLYLAQEGRGIGLANKMRAYHLQDTGLDTLDADQVLGFGPDGRDYRIALSMLEALEIQRVELLTNNPAKVAALKAGGIDVVRRRSVYGRLNCENAGYLRTKAERAGHWLDELVNSCSGSETTG